MFDTATIRRYIPTVILLSAGLVLWFIFSGLANNALAATGTRFCLTEENTLAVEEPGRYDIYYEYRRIPEITNPLGLQFTSNGKDSVLSYSTSDNADYRVLGNRGNLMARVNFLEPGDYSVAVSYGGEQIPEQSMIRIVKGLVWKPVLYQLAAVVSGGILLLLAAVLFIITLLQGKWEDYQLFCAMAFESDDFNEENPSYEETRVFSLAEKTGQLDRGLNTPLLDESSLFQEADTLEGKPFLLTEIPKKAKKAYQKKEGTVFNVRDLAGVQGTAIEEISMNIDQVETVANPVKPL